MITKDHKNNALIRLKKTIALPMSLAFFDISCFSKLILSMVFSIAVFISSEININIREKNKNNFMIKLNGRIINKMIPIINRTISKKSNKLFRLL